MLCPKYNSPEWNFTGGGNAGGNGILESKGQVWVCTEQGTDNPPESSSLTEAADLQSRIRRQEILDMDLYISCGLSL